MNVPEKSGPPTEAVFPAMMELREFNEPTLRMPPPPAPPLVELFEMVELAIVPVPPLRMPPPPLSLDELPEIVELVTFNTPLPLKMPPPPLFPAVLPEMTELITFKVPPLELLMPPPLIAELFEMVELVTVTVLLVP